MGAAHLAKLLRNRAISIYATTTKPLTFAEFLLWDDGSGRDFELVDGIPMPLSEPNANHHNLSARPREIFTGKVFRGSDRLESRLFPDLTLTAEQVFVMSR